jgi:hypothetical protein
MTLWSGMSRRGGFLSFDDGPAMAGVRKQRPFAEGLANGSYPPLCRPSRSRYGQVTPPTMPSAILRRGPRVHACPASGSLYSPASRSANATVLLLTTTSLHRVVCRARVQSRYPLPRKMAGTSRNRLDLRALAVDQGYALFERVQKRFQRFALKLFVFVLPAGQTPDNRILYQAFDARRRCGGLIGVSIFGVTEVSTPRALSEVLSRFAETDAWPTVEISRGASCELVPRLKAGDLDLMLCEGGHEPRQWPATELWRTRLRWITSDAHGRHLDNPLPLSLSPGNCAFRPPWLNECIWRGSALRALERAGRPFKIVSTSASIAGQQVAVQAGVAVTVGTAYGLPEGLRPTQSDEGLPELPEFSLLLLKAREPRQPITDALFAHIVDAFQTNASDS